MVGFSAEDDLVAEVTTWRHGKRAAMTLAFDDVRTTSHEIAAPALEARGFRGTFNLNTAVATGNWDPWIELATRGHELGNHTCRHVRLPDVSLEQARLEIECGRQDLLANVAILDDVVSFTYPYGASSPDVRETVMETHLGARGSWGFNPPTPEDYSLLMGRTYATLDQLKSDVSECISMGGWLIHYFHAVGGGGIPEIEFSCYLDHVASVSDSLWVATQGEVTKYTIERDSCQVLISGTNPGTLWVVGPLDSERFDVPLTIRLQVTSDTAELLVVDGEICPLDEDRSMLVEILPGDSVAVMGAIASMPK